MTLAPPSNLRLTPYQGVAPLRCWGLSIDDLHDRAWATRGVAVVRSHGGVVDSSGPPYYLLLEPGCRALFNPQALRGPTGWLRPRLIRLRLVENLQTPYRETIDADDDGRFQRVQRDYGRRTRATLRAYLTPDPSVARAWAGSTGGLEGKRRILEIAQSRATVAVTLRDGVQLGLPGDSPARVGRFVAEMLSHIQRLGAAINGVYEYAPDIWVHESATIDPRARVVAPVWVGAGVTLGPTDVVVGPRIIDDSGASAPAISTVAWGDLIGPSWPVMMPSFGAHRRVRQFTKRLFDLVFAMGVIVLTLPIYPVIMIAILSEDGWPVFFAHRRQTRGGRDFPCLKFRTMRKDAEAIKARLMDENEVDGPQFYIKDDPRLLRCGAMLRRFQLDEIPQFINVLIGQMSVVGPRPSPDRENQYCPAWREARLSVRPGVTGLWQIRRTREPETDFQEWIRYDLEYVQHESWKLDLWIITQTVKRVLTG